jgi:hypothetical protein
LACAAAAAAGMLENWITLLPLVLLTCLLNLTAGVAMQGGADGGCWQLATRMGMRPCHQGDAATHTGSKVHG